jgi:hypothetical protein
MLIIQTYFNKTLSEFGLIQSLLPNPVIFENFLYRWLLDYWVPKGRLGMEFICLTPPAESFGYGLEGSGFP